MKQTSMFDEPLPQHCVSTHLAPEQPVATGPVAQREKFEGDCGRLLDVLRLRPLMNYELPQYGGLNPRARISDLRKAGFEIVNKPVKSDKPGTTMYTLIYEPPELEE